MCLKHMLQRKWGVLQGFPTGRARRGPGAAISRGTSSPGSFSKTPCDVCFLGPYSSSAPTGRVAPEPLSSPLGGDDFAWEGGGGVTLFSPLPFLCLFPLLIC